MGCTDLDAAAAQLERDGRTVVCVGWERRVLAVSDVVKPEAAGASAADTTAPAERAQSFAARIAAVPPHDEHQDRAIGTRASRTNGRSLHPTT